MAAVREAKVTWIGDLKGSGEVTAATSGRFTSLPVSWAARTEAPGGKTSPEELLAAAHASCFAMAFSNELAKRGATPERLDVTATVTFDKVGERWTVVSSELAVIGHAKGIDPAAFAETAEAARDGCPISRALAGNVRISVRPTLA